MGRSQRRFLLLLWAILLAGAAVNGTASDEDGVAGLGQTRLEDLASLIAEEDYTGAETGARDLLAIIEAEMGPGSPEVAVVLDLLVEALWRGGKATEAETLELADRAVRIREESFGPGGTLVADSLSEKALVLQEREEYSAAETLFLRAQEIYRRSLGPEDPHVASAHRKLAELYDSAEAYPKAIKHAQKALSIYEAATGPKSLEVAETLERLADVTYYRRDRDEAVIHYRRALAIREEVQGAEHEKVGASLNCLGYWLREMGEYEEARMLLDRAVAIREKAFGPEDRRVADSLGNLGNVLRDLGDPDRADQCYLRAISIYEQAGSLRVSVAYAMYAQNLAKKGDLVAARQYAERALAAVEEHLGPQHSFYARTLNVLGRIHLDLGDYEQARRYLERAIAIFENHPGEDYYVLAYPLGDLSDLEARTGNLAKARQLAERAVAIMEQSSGEDHPELVDSLEDLGAILSKSGSYGEARVVLERALEILEKTFGAGSLTVDKRLIPLADLIVDTGDCVEALPLYEKAATAIESLYGPAAPQAIESGWKIAVCQASTGLNAEAFDRALRAEEHSREHLLLTLTGLAERVGLQYVATRESGIDLALSVLIDESASGSVERGFDSLIRSRALVLDEMAERRRWISIDADPDLQNLARKLARARSRLAFLTVQGPSGEEHLETYRGSLKQARTDRDNAERELAEVSRSFRLHQERRRTGLAGIKAALPAVSGLVGFVRFERFVFDRSEDGDTARMTRVPSYAAFVLTSRKSSPVLVPLGSAKEIEKLVERLQDQMFRQAEAPGWEDKSAEAIYRKDAELLRRRIWVPLQPYLTDVERLFVVPDGALHLVSLAALPDGETAYLLERGPQIHYLSAERDLVDPPSETIGEGLLALGNPDFDEPGLFAALAPDGEAPATSVAPTGDAGRTIYRGPRSACEGFRTLTFEELKATEQEVGEVIALWREGRRTHQQMTPGSDSRTVAHLNRGKASETAFKLMAPGRRDLHLATHGFFLGGRCPSPAGLENPLLRTGLVMAGANHRQAAGPDEDDGILTAEEIAALDLGGVDWAVLSACETGLGEVRSGEGVFGLRRAFSIAGVNTLIMSLWRVEDEPTRDWMTLLYKRRHLDGLETAEAVHQASLELLERRRQAGLSTHPFYWAGFVAAGDWR